MSEMAVEVLKQQLADLTRDYTGACEAIRQLEANVAEARDRATAAEAAWAAGAREVREACADICDKATLQMGYDPIGVIMAKSLAAVIRATEPLPTPSAALQRVREQEAERALRWAWYEIGHGDPRDEDGVDPGRDEFVAEGMTMLFPTPDAGGPA